MQDTYNPVQLLGALEYYYVMSITGDINQIDEPNTHIYLVD